MSKSSHKNEFRKGSQSYEVFAYIQKNQVVTKKELLDQKFTYFDVTRILTPRDPVDCKGDPRGHPATFGHLYYMERLPGKKFRLRWRKEPMEPANKVKYTAIPSVKKTVEVTEEKEAAKV